jgi:hypothetical protein
VLNKAIDHPYRGKRAVLATKHEKLPLVAPAFAEEFGLEVVSEEVDTDQLGTFTGEIERTLPPVETAVAKARLGIQESGLALGIASEGSIGADPLVPFLTSDIEHMVLVDAERGIVVTEVHRSLEITAVRAEVAVGQNLEEFLQRADFPRHRLIVRPRRGDSGSVTKGIATLYELESAIALAASTSSTGFVVVESDLRAHHSPSRQRNIEHVAQLLATRVSHLCPECRAPGWGRTSYEKGLRCELCNAMIPEAIRQEVLGCVACDFTAYGKVLAERADPSICPRCNP